MVGASERALDHADHWQFLLQHGRISALHGRPGVPRGRVSETHRQCVCGERSDAEFVRGGVSAVRERHVS